MSVEDTVLSIDIGGTKTLVGLVTRSGEVIREAVRPTRCAGGEEIERALRFGCEFAASSLRSAPIAVVAGVPEYVTAGGLVDSCEVLSWRRQPAEALQEIVSKPGALVPNGPLGERIPTAIGSDVRLGALGEARHGAGSGLASFLYVSLGTGLSSAFVLDSVPWAGARGQAIALGEFAVAPGMNLERTSSGTAISERYAAATGERVTGQEIVSRAGRGDAAAAAVLNSAGEALGDALADATELLDPHGIVVGGGLGSADTPVMDAARARYEARTRRRPGAAPLLSAACGEQSALLGGAAAAWRLVEA